VFILAVVVTLAFLILPSWNAWRFYTASEDLSAQENTLQNLIGTITHLSEALAMSARMAAVTGEFQWEQRYRKARPDLQIAIEDVTRLAPAYTATAERTAAADRNLFAMDSRVFDLVRKGRRREAEALLASPEYSENRRAYAQGIAVLIAAVEQEMQRALQRSERHVLGAGVLALLSAGALVLSWIGGVALIWRHLALRARAERERKFLEAQIQQMQKVESLGVLAGGIAHDFNNLLMPILGNAQLVLDDLSEEAPSRARLEQLRSAGRRLSELTNQLLSYTGKGTFAVQPADLSALVREMTQLLEVSVSKNVTLEYELRDDLPSIEGDVSQLKQVVMNLVTNASDALADEGGVIRVRTDLMEADRAYLLESHVFEDHREGPYVYLEVSDSGCGMDAETQRRVFEPFFTTKHTGRGLGLAVILGIVRGHRGSIHLVSEPGKGAEFRILFPAAEGVVVAIPAPPAAPAAPGAEQWRSSGFVLMVDDEPDVREVTEIMLQRFGFTVLTARDGREGVEVFRKFAPEIDLVLLDLTMPGMSGEEAFAEIQRLKPDQPVVLISGYNEEFVASRLAGRPATFLQKPFTDQELGETVRSLLRDA
jgi:signal transduction histidine kinase/CheY-like chemotaxis protein